MHDPPPGFGRAAFLLSGCCRAYVYKEQRIGGGLAEKSGVRAIGATAPRGGFDDGGERCV